MIENNEGGVVRPADDIPGTNPFEDDGRAYKVLVNSEDQHSLWPADIAVPDGWSVILEAGSRADCLAFVKQHWSDMRPASLRAAMGSPRES
jgi:MbtH protein